ncbi:unnamed protein product [Protopolystoma xenopodis]|uniref:EGF-like domain-containing protein n=1 Tax=Protopolystoma xenopodis TaxID=117903 RepID=A0A448WJS8_9PLAT|nr:unnamed protein product [Protopolystoma xenopodis]
MMNGRCEDINECSADSQYCREDGEYCRNTIGSFECACKSTHIKKGDVCVPKPTSKQKEAAFAVINQLPSLIHKRFYNLYYLKWMTGGNRNG